MPRKKKRIGKFKIPEKSEIPKDELNTKEFSVESSANELVIAELQKIKNEILKENKNKKNLTDKERIKILQDLAIKKVKDNQVLQKKLKEETEKHSQKRKKKPNQNKSAINKAKQQVRKIEVAYIEYYEDGESKVYNWIPLYKIPPIITNTKKRELFLLEEPAKYLNGKKVFILIKGFPFSIPMNFFIDDLRENLEKMPNLEKDKDGKAMYGRAHLSPIDLFAKYFSIKFQMLFGIKRGIVQSFLTHAVCFIVGMMTLYIILSPYLFAGD